MEDIKSSNKQNVIIYTINNYLAQYELIPNKLNKIKLTKYFAGYLISVYQFIIDNRTFNSAVIYKMNEFKVEINDLYNNDMYKDNEYYFDLFNQTIFNINSLLRLIKKT
jgi:hypothetical protein